MPAADVIAQAEARSIDERLFRVALTLDELDILKKCLDQRDPIALQEAAKFFEITDSDLPRLLHAPFTSNPVAGRKPFSKSRFSNGDHGVFYSAQEQETAGKEYAHNAPKYLPETMGKVELRLHMITCRVQGTFRDLRPLVPTYPDLMANEHDFCQEVGQEAVGQTLDGLLAASVRNAGGTNAAVLKRACLSEPEKAANVACLIDTAAKTAICLIVD